MSKIGISFCFYVFASVFFVACDIKSKQIRRVYLLCYISIVFFCLCYKLNYEKSFISGFLGGFVAFSTFLLTRISANNKLGFADVLYATGQGLFLGIEGFFVSSILACLLALIGFLIKELLNSKQKSMPFVPFLALGSLLFLFASL